MKVASFLFSKGVPRKTAEAFAKYHAANPQVWVLFKRFALEAIASGTKIGSRAIAERVRWECAITSGGDDFKVNNNYTASYAHIFMAKYPEHRGYFETRSRRAA